MKNIFLGLTGNVGSGKTTVLNLLQSKGFRTLNADEMVHAMFISSHSSYIQLAEKIDEYFKTSFSESNLIDRNILRSFIKENSNSLKILAEIVKPFITEEILKEKHSGQNTVVEVPLLFESFKKDVYDKVILVYCNDDERKKRIKIRNPNWSDEHIKIVMGSQMNQQEKITLADYIIFNHEDADLHEQIDKTIDSLKLPKINLSYQNK